MDTSYKDAVNTDDMTADQIQVQSEPFVETYHQAHSSTWLTQTAPFATYAGQVPGGQYSSQANYKGLVARGWRA
jgi:hypothetical protein